MYDQLSFEFGQGCSANKCKELFLKHVTKKEKKKSYLSLNRDFQV